MRLLGSTRFLPRRLTRRFVETNTRNESFSVVVDVGAGRAPYKKLIQHDRYIGIDIEDRGGVSDIIIADINNGIPLDDNSADLVLCMEVLEHTKNPELIVQELYRVVRPGGQVLLSAPMAWPLHEVPNDFFRFTCFGFEHLFKTAGFTNLKIEGSNGHWYSLMALILCELRSPLLYPLVVFGNLIGYVLYYIERTRTFPLEFYAKAVK